MIRRVPVLEMVIHSQFEQLKRNYNKSYELFKIRLSNFEIFQNLLMRYQGH